MSLYPSGSNETFRFKQLDFVGYDTPRLVYKMKQVFLPRHGVQFVDFLLFESKSIKRYLKLDTSAMRCRVLA